MDKPRDIVMEAALINLAVFRSIHHSAAVLALSKKFSVLWKASFETKMVRLEISAERVDLTLLPVSASDAVSTGTSRTIETATLWEAALEAGVPEEELTKCLHEVEMNETSAPKDEIWKKLGDLLEEQASEGAKERRLLCSIPC